MSVNVNMRPGIYFEAVQPVLQDALPRMDIASFVGFASAGPLHTPVVVESIDQFRDIFGADLALAWNNERNQVEHSYLGSAVTAFFRNGGRRCWVVRVADETQAQTALYSIPGLIRTNGLRVESAYANARCPGGWAERVHLNTLLQVMQLRRLERAGLQSPSFPFFIDDSGWRIDVLADTTQIETGDLLAVGVDQEGSIVYLYVESITALAQGVRLAGTQGYLYISNTHASPLGLDAEIAIEHSDDARFLLFNLNDVQDFLQLNAGSPAVEIISVRRLRFELLATTAQGDTQRLSGLGFVSGQARFWGHLPDDESLYRHTDGQLLQKNAPQTAALIAQASTPRFPFSAPEDAQAWHYLPTEMNLIIDRDAETPATFPLSVPRLEREGLVNFGARHFVDARLQNVRGDVLKQQAHSLAYLSQQQASKKLRGLHSLLLVDEATIVAVPDAIHRGWDTTPPAMSLPLLAPKLETIETIGEPGEFKLTWTVVHAAQGLVSYILEWSTDANFSQASQVTITGEYFDSAADVFPQAATEYDLSLNVDCPKTYYFRVRAESEGEVSAWSNHKALRVPESSFLNCEFTHAAWLELQLNLEAPASPNVWFSPEEEGWLLTWGLIEHFSDALDIDSYELERASDRLFVNAELIFDGTVDQLINPDEPAVFVEDEPDLTFYYRVRAIRRGTTGPWSNTITVYPSRLTRTTLQAVADFSNQDLLAVHRALLRSSYTRGDLFAVLALPRHYQVQDAIDHYAFLSPSGSASVEEENYTQVPALSIAEQSALTHGAFYYPWVSATSESSGQGRINLAIQPPDGAIAGKIAASAITYGAWVAPANSPLADVLALETSINDAQWARLTESRVNVIRQAPSGFILLSANTLSLASELGEINVRRLMSLLLRVAQREGNRYVFEPNSAAFQERVQVHFESVFAKLFERGAFAGRSSSQAYRVVTDSSVNTRQSIEAGRFIVELHVAPSRALKFIRVRLMQSSPSQLQVQEVY